MNIAHDAPINAGVHTAKSQPVSSLANSLIASRIGSAVFVGRCEFPNGLISMKTTSIPKPITPNFKRYFCDGFNKKRILRNVT